MFFMRMRSNWSLGNSISRCLKIHSRFNHIAVTFRHVFIALLIVNGLSVRLFSAASHSPNFSPFFPFSSANIARASCVNYKNISIDKDVRVKGTPRRW